MSLHEISTAAQLSMVNLRLLLVWVEPQTSRQEVVASELVLIKHLLKLQLYNVTG